MAKVRFGKQTIADGTGVRDGRMGASLLDRQIRGHESRAVRRNPEGGFNYADLFKARSVAARGAHSPKYSNW